MVNPDYLLLFAGMGLVTYLPRYLPLALFAKREVPAWFSEWLSLIPPAILAALLAPALILDRTAAGADLDLANPRLWAALPTLVFAVRTKSLGGSVVAGMLAYWLAQKALAFLA